MPIYEAGGILCLHPTGEAALLFRDLKVVCGSAHPELGESIARAIHIVLSPIESVTFSNEIMMVQICDNVRGSDVFVGQPSCAPVSDGIVELLMIVDALKHASAGRITAVLPYFPYARSDKKDRPRISVTARLIADLLESAGCNRILTMDLRSPQVQGFFRIPSDHMTAIPLLTEHLRHETDPANSMLVAGDVGASKDAARYAERVGLPVAIIDKRRLGDGETVKAVELIGSVEGRHAIVVDDEVASGGTMIEAAEFIRSRGAESVRVVAVHPILSGRALERLNIPIFRAFSSPTRCRSETNLRSAT